MQKCHGHPFPYLYVQDKIIKYIVVPQLYKSSAEINKPLAIINKNKTVLISILCALFISIHKLILESV